MKEFFRSPRVKLLWDNFITKGILGPLTLEKSKYLKEENQDLWELDWYSKFILSAFLWRDGLEEMTVYG